MRDRFTRVLKGHIRGRPRNLSARNQWRADRRLGPRRALARGSRFRPWHGPRHRLVSLGPRGSSAHRQERNDRTCAGDDHIQRARLLCRWRIRNPHREPARRRGEDDCGGRTADVGFRDAVLRPDRSQPHRTEINGPPTRSRGSTITTRASARFSRRESIHRPGDGSRRRRSVSPRPSGGATLPDAARWRRLSDSPETPGSRISESVLSDFNGLRAN